MSLQLIQLATRDTPSYNQNALQIIESIKGGDLEVILQFLEYADKCFKDQNESVIRKFLVLQLIKDCVVIKSGKLINALAGNKSILSTFEQICLFDAGNDDPYRGKQYFNNKDPELSAKYVRLCLELVNHLGKTYPLDARKNSTKFKILLDSLLDQNVIFPPTSDLMSQFKKTSPLKISKTQLEPSHDNQFESQKNQDLQKPQLSSQERDQIMIKINEIKKSINDDIEMLSDTLRENLNASDRDYVHDVLDTFSQSLAQTSQEFRKQIDLLSKFQHNLDARDMKDLQKYLEFSELYPQYHDQFLQERSTPQAFERLKQKVLTLIDKTIQIDQNHQTPQENIQLQKVEQQQKNEDQIKQQQEQIEREKQLQKEQEMKLLKEKQLQEQILKEQQFKEQQIREQLEREQRERQEQEQIRQKELQLEQEKKEQQRLIEQERIKQNEQMRQQELEEQLQQQRRIQQQSFQNWGEVNDEQTSIQKPNLNIVSEQRSMKILQASQRQSDQQSQQVDLDTFGRHISQKQQSVEQKHQDHFDKNFDAVSKLKIINKIKQGNTSLSALGSFPANQQVNLPLKKHLGRIIYPHDAFQNWFRDISEKDLRLWKVHNIRQRGVIYENSLIQIGAICELQFNFIQQKSYLYLTFYFGNKTDKDFKNVKIKYFGEQNSVNLWIKPEQIESEILAGIQIKQSLIFQFKDSSYMAPYSVLQFQNQGNQVEVEFNVPCSLIRFMDFKDVDERIFRAKWRKLKLQVIRSLVLNLNTRVIKSGQDFRKYLPSLIEIQTYQKFMEQRIDLSREINDRKYINYKLGGIFDFLDESETYMLKIIIYPNMKFCVQLIAPFEKKIIAENLLQTIMFIFSI